MTTPITFFIVTVSLNIKIAQTIDHNSPIALFA